MNIITDSRCVQYAGVGHPERPERVSRSEEKLKRQKRLPITWLEPLPVADELLLRAHTPKHLARLQEPSDFDADTPFFQNIGDHARRSVGGALQALKCARRGESAFSLMRPPGHHATRDRAMGFCYLSTAAIAALEARATGMAKVAIYDFDLHHGNGTEEILHNQPGCAFFSIHQFPAYPGSGAHSFDNCHNYPVAPRTDHLKHREILKKALDELKAFKPDLVIVSAGFDAFRNDPLGQELLETQDYHWLGQEIRKLAVPSFSVLEGGYSQELPELILAYLLGLAGQVYQEGAATPAR